MSYNEKNVNAIIDIAKQELDDYSAELMSLGVLESLSFDDYIKAYNRVAKLAGALADLLERGGK